MKQRKYVLDGTAELEEAIENHELGDMGFYQNVHDEIEQGLRNVGGLATGEHERMLFKAACSAVGDLIEMVEQLTTIRIQGEGGELLAEIGSPESQQIIDIAVTEWVTRCIEEEAARHTNP